MKLKMWLAIGVASLGFGTSGVATRAALGTGIEPFTLVALRATAAASLIYVILLLSRRRLTRNPRVFRTAAIFSIFQLALPFVLFTFAYNNASAGFVGLMAAMLPLATAVLAHFYLPNEPLSTPKLIGLVIALVGVGFMLLSGDSGLAEGGRPLLAAFLATLGLLSVAGSGIIAKRESGTYDPLEITGMQNVGGGLLLLIAMLIVEGMPWGITTWGYVLVAYLTVMGSVVPFLLFYWLLRHFTATQASLMAYVVPLVSLFAGIQLLDEQLQLGIGIGGVLILIGVIWTDRVERLRQPVVSKT